MRPDRPVAHGIDLRLQALALERRAQEMLRGGLQPFVRPLDVDELVAKHKEWEASTPDIADATAASPPGIGQTANVNAASPTVVATYNRLQKAQPSARASAQEETPASWRACWSPRWSGRRRRKATNVAATY